MANFFKQLFVGSQFTSSPSRQSQDYYQAVLEQAIDAVVSIDSHNKVTFLTPQPKRCGAINAMRSLARM